MPKLPIQSTPGFNSGKNHSIRLMRLSDIKIDPVLSKMFSRDEKLKLQLLKVLKPMDFTLKNLLQFGKIVIS